MIDQLEAIWDQIIDLMAVFVVPNWNDPVGWIPILLLVGVVGPLLSLLLFAWLWYGLRKPRVRYVYQEPSRRALLDGRGEPVFPTGEPHCPRDGLIFAWGTGRCDVCGDPLRVICPKCLVVREVTDDTCGNCGLSISLKPVLRVARPSAGPPPGGAAAA